MKIAYIYDTDGEFPTYEALAYPNDSEPVIVAEMVVTDGKIESFDSFDPPVSVDTIKKNLVALAVENGDLENESA